MRITELKVKISGDASDAISALQATKQGQDQVAASALRTAGAVKTLNEAEQDHAASLGKVGDGLSKASEKAKELGKQLKESLTDPILDAGKEAAKMSMDFEEAMQKIAGSTTAGNAEIERLSPALKKIAADTGQMPQVLADAAVGVEQLGFRGKEALDILGNSARLSASGMGTVAEASTTLGNALVLYRGTALTAAKATDVFAAAVRESGSSPQAFEGAMNKVLPGAAKLKLSFSDVMGSMSAMARTGGSVEDAGTAMREVFEKLYHPTQQTEKALEAVGLKAAEVSKGLHTNLIGTFGELSKAADKGNESFDQALPGMKKFTGEMALTGKNADQVKRAFDLATDSAGTAGSMFAGAAHSAGFAWKQAMADVAVAQTDLGDAMAPVIKELAKGIKTVADKFRGMTDEQRAGVIQIGLYAAAIGPAISILIKLAEAYTVVGKAALVARAQMAMANIMGAEGSAAAGIGGAGIAGVLGAGEVALAVGGAYAGYKGAEYIDNYGKESKKRDAWLEEHGYFQPLASNGRLDQSLVIRGREAYARNEAKEAADFAHLKKRLEDPYFQSLVGTYQNDKPGMVMIRARKANPDIVTPVGFDPRFGGHFTLKEERTQNPQVLKDVADLIRLKDFPGLIRANKDKTDLAWQQQKLKEEEEALQDFLKNGFSGLLAGTKGGGSGGGGGKPAIDSSAAREAREIYQQYKSDVYDLVKAVALGSDTSRSAAYAYDIQRGKLEGLTKSMAEHKLELMRQKEAADQLAEANSKWESAMEKQRQSIRESHVFGLRDRAAMDTKGVLFNELGPQDQIMAIVLAQKMKVAEQAKKFRESMAGDPSMDLNPMISVTTMMGLKAGQEVIDLRGKTDATLVANNARAKASADEFSRMQREFDMRKLMTEAEKMHFEVTAGNYKNLSPYIKVWLEWGAKQLDQDALRRQEMERWKEQIAQLGQEIKGIFNNAFEDLYKRGFKGFIDSVMKGWEQMLLKMAQDWLAAQLTNSVMRGLHGVFGGKTEGSVPGAAKSDGFVGLIGDFIGGIFGHGGKTASAQTAPPKLAKGGDVYPGRAYIVGEERPEVFVPRTEGRIIPSVGAFAAAGGGGHTIHVHQTIVAPTPGAYRESASQIGAMGAAAIDKAMRRTR